MGIPYVVKEGKGINWLVRVVFLYIWKLVRAMVCRRFYIVIEPFVRVAVDHLCNGADFKDNLFAFVKIKVDVVDKRHQDLVVPRIEYPEFFHRRLIRIIADEHLKRGVVLVKVYEVCHVGVKGFLKGYGKLCRGKSGLSKRRTGFFEK